MLLLHSSLVPNDCVKQHHFNFTSFYRQDYYTNAWGNWFLIYSKTNEALRKRLELSRSRVNTRIHLVFPSYTSSYFSRFLRTWQQNWPQSRLLYLLSDESQYAGRGTILLNGRQFCFLVCTRADESARGETRFTLLHLHWFHPSRFLPARALLCSPKKMWPYAVSEKATESMIFSWTSHGFREAPWLRTSNNL